MSSEELLSTAQTNLRDGKFFDAVDQFDEYLDLEPEDDLARADYATTLRYAKRLVEAEKQARQAFEQSTAKNADHADPAILYSLCMVLFDTKHPYKTDEAEVLIGKALEAQPNLALHRILDAELDASRASFFMDGTTQKNDFLESAAEKFDDLLNVHADHDDLTPQLQESVTIYALMAHSRLRSIYARAHHGAGAQYHLAHMAKLMKGNEDLAKKSAAVNFIAANMIELSFKYMLSAAERAVVTRPMILQKQYDVLRPMLELDVECGRLDSAAHGRCALFHRVSLEIHGKETPFAHAILAKLDKSDPVAQLGTHMRRKNYDALGDAEMRARNIRPRSPSRIRRLATQRMDR